ncbi:MAG: adenylate/guanylate cyclase domain-containing protein [Verrucomicrobiota bacterium]
MSKRRSPFWRVCCAGILGVALATGFGVFGLLSFLNQPIYDKFLTQEGRSAVNDEKSPHVSVVAVTNSDVTRLNKPFPWPRDEQSVIFEKIAASNPSAVAVDLLYPEPTTPEADGRLSFQLAACGRVVSAFYFDDEEGRTAAADDEVLNSSGHRLAAEFSEGEWLVFERPPALPTQVISAGVARVGHTHSIPDPDGVIRRVPLLVRDNDRFYPSLALQAALLHWDIDWSQMSLTSNRLRIVDTPDYGTIEIPLDSEGQMLLNFSASSERRFAATDVFSLMENETPGFDGRVVCVGSLVTGHGDVYPTPINPSTPGLLINALALDQILENDFIQEAPVGFDLGLAFLTAILAALLVWIGRPVFGVIASLLFVFGVCWLTFWLLKDHQFWLAPGASLVAGMAAAGLASLDHYVFVVRRHQRTVNAFSRYLGPNLGKILAENPDAFDSGPKRKILTVFFSDIISYTATSEALESEELIGMLNRYFDRMAEIAFDHEATISKYMGDGMMVFFNDPIEQADHAGRGIRMAKAMQQAIPKLNQEFERQGLPPLKVRMGLNSGYAHVGNVGSAGFSDFTVIGPAVNLAARVMGEAGGGEIYIGSKTKSLADSEFDFDEVGKRELKGVREAETIFRVC